MRTEYLIFFVILLGCAADQDQVNSSWPMYSSSLDGAKYKHLDQINRNNVSELEVAWTWTADDMREQPRTTIQCNPIIIDSTMYLTTPGLKVAALDAATGSQKWIFDPYDGEHASGVNRGVTYWDDGQDGRILYVAGSFLYAISAKTGLLITEFGEGGRADLYDGLGRDVRSLWVTTATPGIIFNDLIILGSTLGEGPSAVAPGHLRAFNARTGKQEWIFHTIPEPDEMGYETWPEDAYQRTGGANAWGGFTLDADRGLVFCGTGSAAYDHWGGDRIGSNLFANCILALDAATGAYRWHYQVVHHDIWDYDLPCAPNLVQVKQGDKTFDAIAQPTKMGHLFILERETGEPLFPIEEKPVPQSTVPGEESWPTQPFPPKSLQYSPQRFTRDEVTDLTPEATQTITTQLDSLDTGNVFLPPSLRGAVTLPQFNGGTDWGGAAYNPESRTLFVNCSNEVEWISMVKAVPPKTMSQYDFGAQLYSAVCASCHGHGLARNPGAPSLSGLREIGKSGAARIEKALLEGKGQMPGFANLSSDEREALRSYIQEIGKDKKLNRDSLKLTFSSTIPYVATGHNEFRDAEGFPANKRPWGLLNAIDMDQGIVKWQVPLGTYPELEARGESPTGTFNMGGPIATSGGLVFIASTMDERFRAFDQETGKVLWEFQLDAGGYATPATYKINGKQYVVIAAGGGGKPGTKPGNKYYCFALPD